MEIDKQFRVEIEERSGQNIKPCYQCLKCFAGCPVAGHMDIKPNGLIRMIQYGMKDRVLKSHAIWLCVSCMTCGVRCPNDIDMSVVFDTLREMAIEAGYSYESEPNVVKIHEEFVRSIKTWGRLHEVSFFMIYMARSLDLSCIPFGLKIMAKGKFPLKPVKIDGVDEIQKIHDESYGKMKARSE